MFTISRAAALVTKEGCKREAAPPPHKGAPLWSSDRSRSRSLGPERRLFSTFALHHGSEEDAGAQSRSVRVTVPVRPVYSEQGQDAPGRRANPVNERCINPRINLLPETINRGLSCYSNFSAGYGIGRFRRIGSARIQPLGISGRPKDRCGNQSSSSTGTGFLGAPKSAFGRRSSCIRSSISRLTSCARFDTSALR